MKCEELQMNCADIALVHQPKEIYRLQIKDALTRVHNRSIVIWGTRELGQMAKQIVEELGYQVFCYISSRPRTNTCYGLPLYSPDILDAKKHYAIVTTSSGDVNLLLKQLGFEEQGDCDYICVSTIWHDDLNYGGCFVGRGTYGFQFLHGDSLGAAVKQIGRYCSINYLAKAVTNHPLSYVTTHGMLYNRHYIPASGKMYEMTTDTPRGGGVSKARSWKLGMTCGSEQMPCFCLE